MVSWVQARAENIPGLNLGRFKAVTLAQYFHRTPDPNAQPYSDLLNRTRFGPPERLLLPGRSDLIRTVDQVIDNYFSTSFAAPDLFGDRLPQFRSALTKELLQHTDTGCFWNWPGDTDILIAIKRYTAIRSSPLHPLQFVRRGKPALLPVDP